MVAALIGASLMLQVVVPGSCLGGQHARVRAEAELQEAIAVGCRGSATFRDLVRRIDGSDGIVYVTWARPGSLPTKVLAALQLKISATPRSDRYLWIAVSKWLKGPSLPSVIGHELQHAVEVLADPTVRATDALEARFAPGQTARVLETPAAVRAGAKIRRELQRMRPPCRASGSERRERSSSHGGRPAVACRLRRSRM
jgi:hypothetical protein